MPELRLTLPEPAAAPPPAAGADLQTVLDAWTAATDRLQRTHEALRSEVKRLTDELEVKNRELARRNRLADLGQMAAHIAHEVRNGLVPLKLYLSLLRRRLESDPDSRDILSQLAAGFTGLETTVRDLLHFSSHRDPQLAEHDLRLLVLGVIESLDPQLQAQGIRVRLDVPFRCHVSADRELLERAILNLLLNALDVLPKGGEIIVTSVESPAGVELEIADTGPGIPADALGRLFEPFFTTKGTGTGLGLSIVERIAEAHGGSIAANNCPEGGAAFTLRLPRRATRIRRMAA